MNSTIKYFIENEDTHQWYKKNFGNMGRVHTFGKGWNKPALKNEDYWTTDPNEVFMFPTLKSAKEFIDSMQKINYFVFKNKNLVITEHMFL